MAGRPPRAPSTKSRQIKTSLAEAVANGQYTTVKFLVEESGCDLDKLGQDGTSPLCAAALWGNVKMVEYLLSKGADVNIRNQATKWAPLHAAAFQEHGLVVHRLLQNDADPHAPDHKGRTPKDYATISEGIWPFFAAKGCTRTSKAELVRKGIVRKILKEDDSKSSKQLEGTHHIITLSRPGSAYARCEYNPLRPLSARITPSYGRGEDAQTCGPL